MSHRHLKPTLLPLGDQALLIRYSDSLSDSANLAAVAMARRLEARPLAGVSEVAPGLVSVLLTLSPGTDFSRLRGELMMMADHDEAAPASAEWSVPIVFDGEDLGDVAAQLHLSEQEFIARHNGVPLRVLATGFAPGFVYCGFHGDDLVVPRRDAVRPLVPAGTVLFAAGQTAIAATPIRTGWHVIGRTAFHNFDPAADPPTRLRAGDPVLFSAAS